RVDAVKTKTANVATRPRVYHEIDASDPAKIFTVGPGSYINDLIDIAGGVNIAARAASAYPQFSAEEILRSDPEIIVLSADAYSSKPGDVAARQGWSITGAVKNNRIFTIDPNLINRPGPRVGEAAACSCRRDRAGCQRPDRPARGVRWRARRRHDRVAPRSARWLDDSAHRSSRWGRAHLVRWRSGHVHPRLERSPRAASTRCP